MTDTQLDILDAVLATPFHWACDDLDRIHAAWIADDTMHGHVSPNCVRKLLTNDAGNLTVSARRLSASYSSRLLTKVGEVRSDDAKGRNKGAVVNLYAWVGAA